MFGSAISTSDVDGVPESADHESNVTSMPAMRGLRRNSLDEILGRTFSDEPVLPLRRTGKEDLAIGRDYRVVYRSRRIEPSAIISGRIGHAFADSATDLPTALYYLIPFIQRGIKAQKLEGEVRGSADLVLAAESGSELAFANAIAAEVFRMCAMIARRGSSYSGRELLIGSGWNFSPAFATEIYQRFPVEIGEVSNFAEAMYRLIYRFVEGGGKIDGAWGEAIIDAEKIGTMKFGTIPRIR